jgi:hypothetical protein
MLSLYSPSAFFLTRNLSDFPNEISPGSSRSLLQALHLTTSLHSPRILTRLLLMTALSSGVVDLTRMIDLPQEQVPLGLSFSGSGMLLPGIYAKRPGKSVHFQSRALPTELPRHAQSIQRLTRSRFMCQFCTVPDFCQFGKHNYTKMFARSRYASSSEENGGGLSEECCLPRSWPTAGFEPVEVDYCRNPLTGIQRIFREFIRNIPIQCRRRVQINDAPGMLRNNAWFE